MENRHGLIVGAMLTPASGTAERDAAEALLARQPGRHRATLGADKGYDTRDFVAAGRALNATPTSPGTRRAARRSTAGPRVIPATRSASGSESGSRKPSAGSRPPAGSGRPGTAARPRVGWMFTLTAAAANLVRLPKLLDAA